MGRGTPRSFQEGEPERRAGSAGDGRREGGTDGRTPAGHPCPHSPSGLMVLSGDSLSLELPLDMRAAMEKALAREESCGLGGGVYSMASRRGRKGRKGWARRGAARAGVTGGGGAGLTGRAGGSALHPGLRAPPP